MPPFESFPGEPSPGVLLPDLTAPSCSERLLRRLMDLGLALFLLLLSAPVMFWAALAVALSTPGPVFYRQKRVGLGGRIFKIWKFRTMFASDQNGLSQNGPFVTAQDDIRITPLGRHLRSWKLDELPQLFNVVRGEMSLVGPRPQVPRFVDCYDAGLRRIVLSVRPGMTGPTALFFRHEEFLLAGKANRECFYMTQFLPVKLQMDAEYVSTRSLRTDLRVLADTMHLVLSRLTGHAGSSGIPTAYNPASTHANGLSTAAELLTAAEPPHAAVSKMA